MGLSFVCTIPFHGREAFYYIEASERVKVMSKKKALLKQNKPKLFKKISYVGKIFKLCIRVVEHLNSILDFLSKLAGYFD